MWKGICGMNGDERKRWHPTQKPIELCAWCLTILKVDSDALVIDPFMGSGSLGVACHRAGLRYLGVEIDPEHYATARERLRRETAQGILIPTGGTNA
jgi:site-specific DNA-methyltransferase (adenine-specific)/modification methylase